MLFPRDKKKKMNKVIEEVMHEKFAIIKQLTLKSNSYNT